ncbi:nucleoside deaminase [Nocardia speluncae]|uniref:Nucleoside deaminase n=1 Tax=Nocardia speluncae TaxID=419477 RepID=A0A846XDA9_9NOCA|nr:nucleoside deaminase [Nocardia speluncae]NKY33375.1 nucleoside deaminase [Nocardia speluncae]
MTITEQDLTHLRRCIDLAREALAAGDQPFGSVLVAADGTVLFEDRNRVKDGDATQHPEFAISRWAAGHLAPEERAAATVYTSGEHCPMCSASHGWVGLGRIVYITSSSQFRAWLREWGVPAAPVAALPIGDIVPGAVTDGPVEELVAEVEELYRACFAQQRSTSS